MGGEHGGTMSRPELTPCIVHALISEVVEVLNRNWDKWPHRELSIETWSREALMQSQSTL